MRPPALHPSTYAPKHPSTYAPNPKYTPLTITLAQSESLPYGQRPGIQYPYPNPIRTRTRKRKKRRLQIGAERKIHMNGEETGRGRRCAGEEVEAVAAYSVHEVCSTMFRFQSGASRAGVPVSR
ncbi:hypothetical protein K491DRAFT_456401 [Lophiostoma macrostomum CBS 122681]|uniref:Uncharacterized protein n=1 Tax=Lophiostoma macrostomum CBS 122681 TaxID=1314788 RepID=A0A6A6T6G5_9PLEO|nr:hypothetical protein K491DRAFT_456401 [Lophiostoma macrostomum CBS 122681]